MSSSQNLHSRLAIWKLYNLDNHVVITGFLHFGMDHGIFTTGKQQRVLYSHCSVSTNIEHRTLAWTSTEVFHRICYDQRFLIGRKQNIQMPFILGSDGKWLHGTVEISSFQWHVVQMEFAIFFFFSCSEWPWGFGEYNAIINITVWQNAPLCNRKGLFCACSRKKNHEVFMNCIILDFRW